MLLTQVNLTISIFYLCKVSIQSQEREKCMNILINKENLKEVEWFSYMGSIITNGGKCIKARIAKVKGVLYKKEKLAWWQTECITEKQILKYLYTECG